MTPQRRNFQIMPTQIASNPLNRLDRMHSRHMNIQPRHNLRANMTNCRPIVSRIVSIFEVIEELQMIFHSLPANVALEAPRLINQVVPHVCLEGVLVAELLPALHAHSFVLHLNMELPHVISEDGFALEGSPAQLALVGDGFVVKFDMLEECRTFCELFAATNEEAECVGMGSAKVLGDLQEIVKGKVAQVAFDIHEVLDLQLAFCVAFGMSSSLLVRHGEELAVLFGIFDHSRLLLWVLSRSTELFLPFCGFFDFRFLFDVLFNDVFCIKIIVIIDGFDFYEILGTFDHLECLKNLIF